MSGRLPSLTARQVLRALKRAGFHVHHQTGSHATLKNSAEPALRVTVPIHPGELQRRTLMTIIKRAGMTREEFASVL